MKKYIRRAAALATALVLTLSLCLPAAFALDDPQPHCTAAIVVDGATREVLTLAYIAKFLHAAFLGQPSKHLDHVQEAPLTMRVPMAILAIGCIITGIFPGLMLWPINAILGDYNAGSLVVGLSGLQEGPGAWNATGLSVMMAIAAAAGWYFVRRFVVLREVDVHTCGLPTEVATSRMAPSGIYGGLVRRLAWFPGNTSVDNKS